MKKIISILTFGILFSVEALAQEADTVKRWTVGGENSLQFSQAQFTNWAAGGQNSLTAITAIKPYVNRMTKKSEWVTFFDAAYGVQKIEGSAYRKTEDRFELYTKYGIRASDKLLAATEVSFRSQFTNGYTYHDDESRDRISDFMAPGILKTTFGLDYQPRKGLSMLISPLILKTTFVLDQELADAGQHGVKPAVRDEEGNILVHGKNSLEQIGLGGTFTYKGKVVENVNLFTKLELFSTYEDLNSMNVIWDAGFDFKVNRFLTAGLTTSLIYDDKVMIAKEEMINGESVSVSKTRVQFKEIISLGLKFKY